MHSMVYINLLKEESELYQHIRMRLFLMKSNFRSRTPIETSQNNKSLTITKRSMTQRYASLKMMLVTQKNLMHSTSLVKMLEEVLLLEISKVRLQLTILHLLLNLSKMVELSQLKFRIRGSNNKPCKTIRIRILSMVANLSLLRLIVLLFHLTDKRLFT